MQDRPRRSARILAAAAAFLGTGLAAAPRAEASCVQEPYLASICITAAKLCPPGYTPASGQLLPIAANTALFSLIGKTYGGNGVTTFALPKLNGNSQMKPPLSRLKYCIATAGLYPPT